MIPIQKRTSAGSSQQLIKDQNSTLLFDLVRRLAPISRAELSKRSGLSPATVTVLIEELVCGGWLTELGTKSSHGVRGRRPVELQVNGSKGTVATLEILSGGYIVSLYDICLQKMAQQRYRVPLCDSAVAAEQLRQQLHALGQQDTHLLGIHILYPGLFEAETGKLGFSAVIRDWEKCSRTLRNDLRQAFPDACVMLSNNAMAVAYSVFVDDMQEPALPLLVMTVQEGIDAGVILPGGRSIPVEAGHISIDRSGPVCNCGNRGCLEVFCSTTALLEKLGDMGIPLSYGDGYGAGQNTAAMEQLCSLLTEGDPTVEQCLSEYCQNLCCAVVSIVNLLGVRAARIGGSLQLLGAPFKRMLDRTLEENFHILTGSQKLEVKLFEYRYEDARKAAVMQTMETVFSRN